MKVFLFAHAGGNVWDYKRLFAELESEAELIPVELPGDVCAISKPGYGTFEEYTRHSAELIRSEIGINEKMVLFGHSFGGYLVHEIAAELPENTAGIIASCCQPYHLYTMPDKGEGTYLSHFGYNDELPDKLVELFEPLIADKIGIVDNYCQSYKSGRERIRLCIPARIIYASEDDPLCGSNEWLDYYDEKYCTMTAAAGGHFYWRDKPENKTLLVNCLREMIRRKVYEE